MNYAENFVKNLLEINLEKLKNIILLGTNHEKKEVDSILAKISVLSNLKLNPLEMEKLNTLVKILFEKTEEKPHVLSNMSFKEAIEKRKQFLDRIELIDKKLYKNRYYEGNYEGNINELKSKKVKLLKEYIELVIKLEVENLFYEDEEYNQKNKTRIALNEISNDSRYERKVYFEKLEKLSFFTLPLELSNIKKELYIKMNDLHLMIDSCFLDCQKNMGSILKFKNKVKKIKDDIELMISPNDKIDF